VPHPKILEHTKGKLRIFSNLIDRAGNLSNSDAFAGTYVHGKIACNRAENLNHGVLLPDGSVVLCCMDFGMQHVLGNLLVQSYEDIMNGEEINRIKDAMSGDNREDILCRSCSSAIIVQN
jgi:radical SAM protein with 4Fe4S-binding SPASM domain